MKLTGLNFNQRAKLLIDGVEFSFNQKINLKDHVFNNSGSTLELFDVYPKSFTTSQLQSQMWKVKKWSIAEIYFGNDLFFAGIVRMQDEGSFMPFKLKKVRMTIISFKELLTQEPMDFTVLRKKGLDVIDKVIDKLAIPYVAKGHISFTSDKDIDAYNTKDMNAFETLQFVARHTNSTFQISFDNVNKRILVEFYSKDEINNGTGRPGLKIPFDTPSNIETFTSLYEITDFTWKENGRQDANVIRLESEKTLSTRLKKIEIEIGSLKNTIVPTQFEIGKIDKIETKLVDTNSLDASGNPITLRRLSIITQTQAEAGKPFDVAYSQSLNSFEINQRILTAYPNGILIFAYYPLLRQQIDLENQAHQQEVASALKLSKGKLFRYEKFNDITNLSDLLAQGESFLDAGISSKTELYINSKHPIWEVGEHVEFQASIDYIKFAGVYIVKTCEANMWINEDTGVMNADYKYVLSNLKQLENMYNMYDSQAYRDNPLLDVEAATIVQSTTIPVGFSITAKNDQIACVFGTGGGGDETFDYNLDMTFNTDDMGGGTGTGVGSGNLPILII